jgi:acetylornithine deacetylase/succinyl-diaminopimelate desuccinylase-like protein
MNPDLSKTLARFIRYNTVSSRSNAAFAREVGRRLRRGGFKVVTQSAKKDGIAYFNVIGIKGKGGRPLLLCSHLDTVPAGDRKKWTRTGGNPWEAKVSGGRIYGLGAADDKGPLAAMLGAVSGVRTEDLKRPLMFMGTFGEESGMGGAKAFCRQWKAPKPLLAIVGEPTDLGVTYRHKGMGVLVVEIGSKQRGPRAARPQTFVFKGKSGHSSRPWLGDNALDKAVRFLRRRRASFIACLEGGHAANVIPDHAALVTGTGGSGIPAAAVVDAYDAVQSIVKRTRPRADRTFRPAVLTSNFGIARLKKGTLSLTFDFRLLPRQSLGPIFRSLSKRLRSKFRSYPKLSFKVRIERDNPPLDQRVNDPLPIFGKRLLRAEGLPVRLDVKPACTEAGIYASWGVPAVIFGPGRSAGNIHAPNECVRVKDLVKAARFYTRVIDEICVKGKSCS